MRILKLAALLAVIAVVCGVPKVAQAQVPVNLAPVLHPQFVDSTGKVLSGGFLYVYQAGTTTLQASYADPLGTIQNPNPIPLDASGAPSNGSGTQVQVWFTGNTYKVCAYSSALVLQWCWDNIQPIPFLAGNNTWTGNQTFVGTATFNAAALLNSGGTLAGSFSGSPTFSGNPNFSGTPTFSNAETFPAGIFLDLITGTITNGGLMQISGAQATGASAGEGITITAGGGPIGTGVGGGVRLAGGIGGLSGGNGGAATVIGGTASGGNGAGGAVAVTGGNGVGTGAGGAINLLGGTGGATTAPGGTVSVTGGAGGAGAVGGNVVLQPGAGSGTTNGNVLIGYGRLISQASTTQPTCSSSGTGASGTCALLNDSGDSWGLVQLNPAGAGPAATGTITLTFVNSMGTDGVACVWNLNTIGAAWNARATVMSGTQGPATTTASWDNNAVALNAGNSYYLTYFCGGRN
jgi:hypothetical protein